MFVTDNAMFTKGFGWTRAYYARSGVSGCEPVLLQPWHPTRRATGSGLTDCEPACVLDQRACWDAVQTHGHTCTLTLLAFLAMSMARVMYSERAMVARGRVHHSRAWCKLGLHWGVWKGYFPWALDETCEVSKIAEQGVGAHQVHGQRHKAHARKHQEKEPAYMAAGRQHKGNEWPCHSQGRVPALYHTQGWGHQPSTRTSGPFMQNLPQAALPTPKTPVKPLATVGVGNLSHMTKHGGAPMVAVSAMK